MAFRLLWQAFHNQNHKESLCCLYKPYPYDKHEQKPWTSSHPIRESYEKENFKWTLISFSKTFTTPPTRGIFAFSLQSLHLPQTKIFIIAQIQKTLHPRAHTERDNNGSLLVIFNFFWQAFHNQDYNGHLLPLTLNSMSTSTLNSYQNNGETLTSCGCTLMNLFSNATLLRQNSYMRD